MNILQLALLEQSLETQDSDLNSGMSKENRLLNGISDLLKQYIEEQKSVVEDLKRNYRKVCQHNEVLMVELKNAKDELSRLKRQQKPKQTLVESDDADYQQFNRIEKQSQKPSKKYRAAHLQIPIDQTSLRSYSPRKNPNQFNHLFSNNNSLRNISETNPEVRPKKQKFATLSGQESQTSQLDVQQKLKKDNVNKFLSEKLEQIQSGRLKRKMEKFKAVHYLEDQKLPKLTKKKSFRKISANKK